MLKASVVSIFDFRPPHSKSKKTGTHSRWCGSHWGKGNRQRQRQTWKPIPLTWFSMKKRSFLVIPRMPAGWFPGKNLLSRLFLKSSNPKYFSVSRFYRPLFNRRYFLTEWSSLANHIWHHNRAGREMPRDLRGSSGEVDPEKKGSIIVFFKVNPKKGLTHHVDIVSPQIFLQLAKVCCCCRSTTWKTLEKPTHLDFMRCFSETLD